MSKASPTEGFKHEPDQPAELKQEAGEQHKPEKESERKFKHDLAGDLRLGLGLHADYIEWKKSQAETGQTKPAMTPEEMWAKMHPPDLGGQAEAAGPPRLSDLGAEIESPGQRDGEVSYQVRTRSRGKGSSCEDQVPLKGKGKAKDTSMDKDPSDLGLGPLCPKRPDGMPPAELTPPWMLEPQWHNDM